MIKCYVFIGSIKLYSVEQRYNGYTNTIYTFKYLRKQIRIIECVFDSKYVLYTVVRRLAI